jgi:iron complex outermembrane receptor protein
MKKTSARRMLLASVSAIILAAMATVSPAHAQTPPPAKPQASASEEIVVTARKRNEALLDVPFSVNALSESQLRERGAVTIEDVSRNVASFAVQNLGPGQSQVSIRGGSGGQIARDLPGVKEQVGVYLDESVISLSLFTPDLDLFDINRVEVLRGPQGTLYGAGSLAGTVRYITNRPNTDKRETVGEFALSQVDDGGLGADAKAMMNFPLAKNAALRVVGYGSSFPGFINAVQPGGSVKEDVNDGVRYGGRVALLWEPTAKLSLTPRIIYQNIDTNGFNRVDKFNILANPFTTTAPAVTLRDREQFTQLKEKFKDETFIGDLTAAYDFGPVTLTSVSSYTKRKILVLRDATALTGSITGGSIGLSPAITRLNAPLFDDTKVTSTTQELRLASNDGGRFDWVLGAFYADVDRKYGQTLLVNGFSAASGIPTAGPLAPTDGLYFSRIPYSLTQTAGFAEGAFKATDKLSLTAGVRYAEYEEKRVLNFDGIFADQTLNARARVKDGVWAPRFIASYKLNDAVSFNAQASKGFRLGGVNDPINRPLCNPEDITRFGGFDSFRNETAWNYEVGMKSRLAGKGSLTLAAYQTDIEDLQVTITAGSCSSRIVFNAPKARTRGVEAELNYQLTDRLDVAAALSYNTSELTQSLRNANGTVFAPIREGNRLPSSPEWQGSAALTYSQPINAKMDGFASLNVQYVGERFTQLADQETNPARPVLFQNVGGLSVSSLAFPLELEAYTLANVRFGARWDGFEAAVFVNNVTDERAELALDRERDFRARYGVLINQPRTFGITLRSEF